MKKLIFVLFFAITSFISFSQKIERGAIMVDVSECYQNLNNTSSMSAATNTFVNYSIYGYYLGFNSQGNCYNVLIVIVLNHPDGGQSVVGYGTACIPQYNQARAYSELPKDLKTKLNECAFLKLAEAVWNSDFFAKNRKAATH